MSVPDGIEDREIFTLGKLAIGERARVVHLTAVDSDQLLRLSNLGIVPGVELRLAQTRPAAVIEIGEMQVAVDPEIIDGIWVKRVDD